MFYRVTLGIDMPISRIILLTCLAMIFFAANSVFCRLALKDNLIDPATFTSLRIISGAVILAFLVYFRAEKFTWQGNWLSALSLFVYCAGFSFAYINLSTGTGALLLFGAVQLYMLAYARYHGESIHTKQKIGLLPAISGSVLLLLPGSHTPPLVSAFLMIAAGIAWAIYTINGKNSADAINNTTGNFMRAAVLTSTMSICLLFAIPVLSDNFSAIAATNKQPLTLMGIMYAILSGALASGIGYAIWYKVLPYLSSVSAASVQLSVPVIAAFAGTLFLQEPITLRFFIATLAILGGISLINMKQAPVTQK